jgi:hypothetical protein
MPTTSTPMLRRVAPPSHDPCRLAAGQIIVAANSLIGDPTIVIDRCRCRAIARALAGALANPHARRADILAASPFVIERSGRDKTLVEMIEEDESEGAAKLRLARLLLRAIEWA